MANNVKIDQLLDIINKNETSYASNIWIPSLKRDVRFLEINTAQQKRLVKAQLDSTVINTDFMETLRDIIKENCKEDVDIDQLTIVDKLLIAIALRCYSIGSSIETEIGIKGGKSAKIQLDLNNIYEIAKSTIGSIEDLILEDETFKITCSTPTIKAELDIEKNLKAVIESNKSATLVDIVGDAYVAEALKYIKELKVKSGDQFIDAEWNTLNLQDKQKIIVKLRAKTLAKIIQFSKLVHGEADKIELVSFEFDGEKYQKRLSIDENFFMIS